ncbi:MAG: acyl-CoA/acyl-ACP dehydrogenase [Dehalococcoidia bacterium]|nr:acyl-CoA/acyl-ACP dehydrogenase [Dehalococcoidia bacterium]MDW8119874.1 acyl-CoA dehydrogenase family protein [Chloroflexota bacterium]
MDLGLSEAQQMLKNSAREFLEKECPHTYVRAMEEDEKGYTVDMWKKLAELGWLGLPFPEAYGGLGNSFLDLCVLLEEMGRALLPGPYFSTVVLFGLTVLDAGSEAQKRDILPKIASGDLIGTFAITEPSARWDAEGIREVQATRRGTDWVLTGTKLFVPYAHVSDTLLVAARTRSGADPTQGITCFLVPTRTSGISQTLLKTIASDRQSEVTFQNVVVPGTAVLGQVDQGWPIVERAIRRAAAATCCWMVGGAQRVLEMTVDYAKQRIQFGRPIGSFQAVQHHCANMAVDVEGARYIAYQAAWAISEGQDARMEVAMAKAWCSDAYRRVCALAHQCHGAIGFTKEHNLQLYTRRAKAAELMYGDADFHRELVAQGMRL